MQISESEHFKAIKQQIGELKSPVFFVHSDIMRGFPVKLEQGESEKLFQTHFDLLAELTNPADLWFPVFNLAFPKTRVHDVQNTPSQMGYLSEYFRKNIANWRDEMPMHSSCGTGKMPNLNAELIRYPWGQNSVFERLVQQKGCLLFYGIGLPAVSFLHYAEQKAAVPYRYEKQFPGKLINAQGEESDIIGTHIVRPIQYEVDYDWQRLQMDLEAAKLWHDLSDKRTKIILIPAAELDVFWSKKLAENPLYLLDKKTLESVEPIYHKLQRGFTLSDFE